MSLKAKLEAVVYAAEEPVTLAQLAALFADEALEWKAKRDAATAADGPPGAVDSAQSSEAPAQLELEQAGSDVVAEAGASDESAAEAEVARAAKLREREARAAIKLALDELIAEYASDERGIEIREIAGGYRMATKPQCHDAVRCFVKSLKPPLKLSLPALETLAVIAYKQPVTAPEVNEIRGVDSSGVFGSLLARKLIVTAGRKPVVGRPILYKTTREFLLRFGLKDVTELPSMEEFEKIAASEFEEEMQAGADEDAAEGAAEFDASLSAETEEAASEAQAEASEDSTEGAPSRNE